METTEDDIDNRSLPRLMQLCKEHQISTEGLRNINVIKCLLKYELISDRTDISDATTFLASKKLDNQKQKQDLSDIYDDVINFVNQLTKTEETVITELNKEFPSISEDLESSCKKMMNSVPSVLVLGETGSGKSRFINLLLGEEYFPSSILSTTHVICEIRYSNQPRAVLYKADVNDDNPVTITQDLNSEHGENTFLDELKKHIQMVDGKTAVYCRAEVYLKCQMLKSGLVIVDSPGIGESDEMTKMVINYILNATVFIYIIDSTNAGGMQDRVTKLVQKVYKKSLHKQKICRPDSALFICNKWDDVKTKERDDVLKSAREKIRKAWPKCQDDQIICFSTAEAEYIQKRGRMAPKFRDILQKISRLIEVGQDIIVLRGYSFVYQYIDRCIYHFDTHLSLLDMSMDERDKKYHRTNARLTQLKSNITNFFDDQRKLLQTNIGTIAQALGTFINQTENRKKVCSFEYSELPKRSGWNHAAVEVRSKVYNALQSLIKEWEERGELFEKLFKCIDDEFEKKFPDFERQIYQVEKVMTCAKGDEAVAEESEVELMPNFVQSRIEHLNTGTKVALGIGLSPVLLVGFIVRLSVVGVRTLDRLITKLNLEREYNAANGDKEKLKQVCQKYAEKTVDDITSKFNLNAIIEEDLKPLMSYLQQQQKRMECQIESDIRLLKSLKDEEREDGYVIKVFEPLKAKSLIIQQCLLYFMLQHMPSHLTPWLNDFPYDAFTKKETSICSGLMSDVVNAECSDAQLTDGQYGVSICVMKEEAKKRRMHRYISILEAYRIIKNPYIVHCFGFWRDPAKPMLYPVLEGLRCSLRKYVGEQVASLNYDINCLKMMRHVLEGLKFLHDKGLVHFDLCLDTVAVNFRNEVKLTNISPQVKLNIEPLIQEKKVCMSSYIHIAPKFFQNKHSEEYTMDGDMFSVGIMMYEMWKKQGLVEINKLYDIPESVFDDTVDSNNEFDKSIEVRFNAIYHRSSFLQSQSPIDKSFAKSIQDHSVTEGEQVGGKGKGDNKISSWFQEFIKSFHPNLDLEFRDLEESRRKLGYKWKQTINQCMYSDDPLTAASWLEEWEEYPVYPDVSLLTQS